MADDKILMWTDYRDDKVSVVDKNLVHLAYRDYLEWGYSSFVGEPLPDVPDTITETALAFVNSGRWLWKCAACQMGVFLELGELVICVQCGHGGWREVVWPDNLTEIEWELLNQPGRRAAAPIRQWQPSWTMERLQERTAKAAAIVAMGNLFPLSLSIGATRVWAAGEVLSAANMNTFLSGPIDNTAGRDGRVDFENSLRVKTGTDADTQPFLELTQDYIQFPHRSADPLTQTARSYYNTTAGRFKFRNGTTWFNLEEITVDNLGILIGSDRIRRIHVSTADPDAADWANDDIWLKRDA